ncbi:putative copper resistance protein D [Bradyrhizobium sp. JR4.1]|uniref:copper homeostasis membrane protein CopD n=1 Tax=unclassified Bradyrhizobium TaxID=2631580 RepID=UPI003390F43D
MSWFGSEIDGPLALTRAIHFAASAGIAGILMFRGFVAEPALRPSPEGYSVVRLRLAGLAWIALALTTATGLIWLVLQTMSIADLGWGDAVTSGAIWTVVNETQFGLVAEVRAALAVLLAACLLLDQMVLSRWLVLLAASALVAAIAWTGHAGSTLGELGNLHLAADVLHLCAASAWIGGLAGLAILFEVGRHRPALEWRPLELDAISRFSILGMISVAALIVSGLLNTWILVGSIRASLVTDYGRLLLLKIAAFAIMVAFAAVNRFWLTPRLVVTPKEATDSSARSALRRNTLIEIALGLAIFAMVGVLGMLHPAIHLVQ